MRPFRLRPWGSQILLLPLAQSRPRCPLLVQCFLRYSTRLQPSASSSQSTVKRKRGRPRKQELPTQTLESNVAGAAATSPKDDLQSSVLDPVDTTTVRKSGRESSEDVEEEEEEFSAEDQGGDLPLESLPSPPPQAAQSSAKLSALHARLALPSKLPLQTLARTLIDRTADSDPQSNNDGLAHLGNDLLGYYMAEHLLCNYPRLPLVVLYAAQNAYVGPQSLRTVAEGWGMEAAAEPGGEVDPGLLQFKRAPLGVDPHQLQQSNRPQATNRRGDKVDWRRGMSSRIPYDDQFGDMQPSLDSKAADFTTIDRAATTFVRALAAAVYLHAGGSTAHGFFRAHILSRHLDISSLFTFKHPTRDLSRLCAREGFQSPVARLDSESGRLSRHPVFVVGVYSGRDRLGQGVGASLDEARFKAAVQALKGWYLYSPAPATPGGDVMVPSQVEGTAGIGKTWKPAMIDCGEVIS